MPSKTLTLRDAKVVDNDAELGTEIDHFAVRGLNRKTVSGLRHPGHQFAAPQFAASGSHKKLGRPREQQLGSGAIGQFDLAPLEREILPGADGDANVNEPFGFCQTAAFET